MRKTKTFVVPKDLTYERDVGKVFQLTEMPASQAERWAFRAFQALARAGVDLPDNVTGAGIAVVGLKALGTMPFEEAAALMDEMFSCVKIVRDTSHPEMAFSLMEDDVQEVATRVRLRAEVFELHTGFSFAGTKPTSTSTPASSPA